MTTPHERARRQSLRVRVFERLSAGPALNVELCEIGISYKARIFELRREWEIKTEPVSGSLVRYRLVGPVKAGQMELSL